MKLPTYSFSLLYTWLFFIGNAEKLTLARHLMQKPLPHGSQCYEQMCPQCGKQLCPDYIKKKNNDDLERILVGGYNTLVIYFSLNVSYFIIDI